MGRLDPPTTEQLLRMAHDPDWAREALERWGEDVLMNPHGVGLGDLVAKATKAVGIKPCGPCEQRRRKLNRWRIGG